MRIHGGDRVVYEGTIDASARRLRELRDGVAQALADVGIDAATIRDSLLVMSELATNAMHAIAPGATITIRVARDSQDDVIVEVEDGGRGFRLSQQLRLPDKNEEHGRGLSIVCLVADETSVGRRRHRTIVRAVVRARNA